MSKIIGILRLLILKLSLIKRHRHNFELNFSNITVKKYIHYTVDLDKCIFKYLMNLYNKTLSDKFEFKFINSNDCYSIMPLLKSPKFHSIHLFDNTQILLRDYINSKDFIPYRMKSDLVDHIEIYNSDNQPENYFMFNGKIYLLDIEDLFFVYYDKYGNPLDIKSAVKEKYQRENFIEYYNPPKVFYGSLFERILKPYACQFTTLNGKEWDV